MSTTPPGLTPAQVNYSESSQWKQIVRQSASKLRVATPAFLVSDLDPVTQTVTVQVAIQERVRTEAGAAWWDVPPIVNVPIIIPRGGGFSITLPLKKTDEGLLIFCDTCFDYWWKHGQNNAPKAANVSTATGSQTQLEIRRHHIHDCGFLPGCYSQPHVLSNYSADTLQIRSDDGDTVIDVADDGVTITGAAIKATAGGTVQPLMTQAWQTWFTVNVLPHITTGVIPPQPGATTIFEAE